MESNNALIFRWQMAPDEPACGDQATRALIPDPSPEPVERRAFFRTPYWGEGGRAFSNPLSSGRRGRPPFQAPKSLSFLTIRRSPASRNGDGAQPR